jgi:hypothetical protein
MLHGPKLVELLGLICVFAVTACGSEETGTTCLSNTECPAGTYCSPTGKCTYECKTDTDCSGGTCNILGKCVTTQVDSGPPKQDGAPNKCGPSTCAGCCVGDVCQTGTTTSACGKGGANCTACTGSAVCTNGACTVAPCGPSNCAGCCSSNTCQTGTIVNACGKGGVACAICQSGQVCLQSQTCGKCQTNKDCDANSVCSTATGCESAYNTIYLISNVKAKVNQFNYSTVSTGAVWDPLDFPDPYFYLTVGGKPNLNLSAVIQNTLTPSWPTPGITFTVKKGESFRIDVLDQDAPAAEFIGAVEWKTELDLAILKAGSFSFKSTNSKYGLQELSFSILAF